MQKESFMCIFCPGRQHRTCATVAMGTKPGKAPPEPGLSGFPSVCAFNPCAHSWERPSHRTCLRSAGKVGSGKHHGSGQVDGAWEQRGWGWVLVCSFGFYRGSRPFGMCYILGDGRGRKRMWENSTFCNVSAWGRCQRKLRKNVFYSYVTRVSSQDETSL